MNKKWTHRIIDDYFFVPSRENESRKTETIDGLMFRVKKKKNRKTIEIVDDSHYGQG